MGDTVRRLGRHGKGPGLDHYIRLPNPAYVPVVQRINASGNVETYPNPTDKT